jgi:hypothetical protein
LQQKGRTTGANPDEKGHPRLPEPRYRCPGQLLRLLLGGVSTMKDFLLADFKQVDVMRGVASEGAKGACHSFAVHWCSLIYQNPSNVVTADDALKRMALLKANKGGGNAVLQANFLKGFDRDVREGGWKGEEGGWKSLDNLIVSVRGLERVKYGLGGGIAYFDGIDQVGLLVNSPEVDAMVYSFTFNGEVEGAKNGNHTIAFFRKLTPSRGKLVPVSNSVSIFDPNFGEYSVMMCNFAVWFGKWMRHYDDKFITHRLFYVKQKDKS